jgi:hypothetical protein
MASSGMASSGMAFALRFVPYGSLGPDRPSVVVDGSPAPGTTLCLSHWPGIGSPAEFRADLSAEMAFLYADHLAAGRPPHHGAAEVVSNNHFDQDGLVGVFALSAPAAAQRRRELLIEVARAGDFAVTSSRPAARVSMVLSAYADVERSPLPGAGARAGDYDALCAALYIEMLDRLPEICDHLDDDRYPYRALWADEDETLTASIAALASGAVTLEEVPDVDLVVVDVPPTAPDRGGHRFGGNWLTGLHPMAVYNATDRGAVLTVRGRHYELVYRYESWVQFRSRAVRPRVDLAPLATSLTAAEAEAGGSAVWVAGRVSGLTPTLSLAGDAESSLPPAVVRTAVEQHLGAAPAAWDPYAVTR